MKHLFSLLLLLLLFAPAALGEPAQEIACTLRASAHENSLKNLFDGDYKTTWRAESDYHSYLQITAPQGAQIGSVAVKWYNTAPAWRLCVQDADGKWVNAAQSESGFLSDCLMLPEGVSTCRIYPLDHTRSNLKLSELQVFTPGELPASVQRWQPVSEQCDMLLIAAHPDDEVLFMGGTLPTYAGERGIDVQVLTLVPATPQRCLELLDCLWLCGVRRYPILGGMGDYYASSLQGIYAHWSKQTLYNLILRTVRSCRPEVIVTHDMDGEYGHGAHRAAADAAIYAVTNADNPAIHRKSVEAYGTWQVKKLYLHLYAENAVTMDWRTPLSAFDGKTALEVAQEAFLCHASQQSGKYEVLDSGPTDNSRFGLYFSTVGEDEQKNDFMEHILPETSQQAQQ